MGLFSGCLFQGIEMIKLSVARKEEVGVESEERSWGRRAMDVKWIIFRKVLPRAFTLIVVVIKGLIYFKYLCLGKGVGRGGG